MNLSEHSGSERAKGEKQAEKKKGEWKERPVSEIVIMDVLFSLPSRDTDLNLKKKIMFA